MAASILSQLQSAAKGLLYPSEQDNPLTAFLWTKATVGTDALTADAVRKQAHAADNAPVQMSSVEAFFAPLTTSQPWHSAEEKQQVQQAQQLLALIQQQLSEVTVYQFGDTDKHVYVVGKTPQGDYAGVKTRLVET